MNRKFTTTGVLITLTCLPLHAGGCASSPTSTISASQAPAPAVHWEKWSDDLFARAKRENKLVLLDLEAVWCHWCHVMDEVTYADPKVRALLASRYIAVKVDQDSRPDLSNRYENYGWPATIVFGPSGGEIVKRQGYIPPRPMASMLQAIIDDPTPGPSVGKEEAIEFSTASALSPALRQELEAKLIAGYDAKEAGWGTVHKFIDWDAVELCLARARAGDKDADAKARQTLTRGLKLIDPVWGGVYQYSTDGDWDHPHYEKIMSFQAEVMRIYTMAYAQYHDPAYLSAANAIRDYVRQFLTAPEGAFYVSQDADLVQGEHSARYFALDDPARRKLGIPRVDAHVYARENGWAIRGLLAVYDVERDAADLAAATKAAQWIVDHRALPGGGFHHDEQDAAGPYLADTLAMGRAFLALYESSADRDWLARAQSAGDFIAAHFHADISSHKVAGFVTASASPGDPLRPLPQIDENVAAARFFNLLSRYTGRKDDREHAEVAMRYLATPKIVRSRQLWMAGALLADRELSAEPLHITIVGGKQDAQAAALFRSALQAPGGYRRIEWYDPAEGPLPNADVEYPPLKAAAAFVCTGNACSSPIGQPGVLAERVSRR